MSSVPSLPSIVLPPDLASFVRGQVKSGQFDTEADVVREALYLFQKTSLNRAERLERLRAEIQVGLDQLDRGEGVPLDMAQIKQEVVKRLGIQPSES